jgi:hypothetical protein
MKWMKRLNRVIRVQDDEVEMYESNGYKAYDPDTGDTAEPATPATPHVPANKHTGTGSNAGKALTQGALRNLNMKSQMALAEKHGVDISAASNKRERGDLIFAAIETAKGN